jgi:parallel beta-helix repeat protein
MGKAALSLVLISYLIIGAFLVDSIKGNFFPPPTPAGIQITPDGSVVGTDQIEKNGQNYTLLADLPQSIVVQCSSIILDGANHTLTGNGGSTGIFLQGVRYVTVKNFVVSNFSYGINLTWNSTVQQASSNNNLISGNVLTTNERGISLGLFTYSNTIDNNTIQDGTYGISFSTSAGNTLTNNHLNNNRYNLCFDWELTTDFANNIDTSNLVDDKPVIYWVNEHDKVVPSNAGFVGLVDCSNITVKGLKISNNSPAILLGQTLSSQVIENQLENNSYGIVLRGNPFSATIGPCEYNQISYNNIMHNAHDGIWLYGSNHNKISYNNIVGNEENGIVAFYCNYDLISENNFLRNGLAGVKAWGTLGSSFDMDITHNNFISNFRAHSNVPVEPDPMIQNIIFGQATLEGTFGSCNKNYWNDYNGSDLNQDGIGDSPYLIQEYKIGKTYMGTHLPFDNNTHFDSSPLMYPWGSPILSINSPQNATVTGTSLLLNLTVIEPYSITYRLDDKDEVTFAGNTTLSDLAAGNHTLTIVTNDNYGNALSQQITFSAEQTGKQERAYLTTPYFAMTLVVAIIVVVILAISLMLYRRQRRVSKQQTGAA